MMQALIARRAFPLVTLIALALLLAGCGGERGALVQRTESPAMAGSPAVPIAERAPLNQSLDEALAELEALPTPKGVDPAVFAKLKQALAEMLEERFGEGEAGAAVKLPCTPPTDERSVPSLYWAPVNDFLYWRYYSTGDYNQDGFVTINDITPLGQHFNVEGPFDTISAISCVDGNADGWTTINDLTPIGQNFGDNVVAYRAYMSPAPSDYPVDAADDNGGATYIGEIAFSGAEEPEDERKLFRFEVDEAIEGQYCWVRPVDKEGNEGIACRMLKVPLNHAPHAGAVADPVEGPTPLSVDFDASASYDDDGEIISYEWDWDGERNGWQWESSGTEPTVEHTYEFGAEYAVVLRVTDDEGDTDEAGVGLNVLGSWHFILVTTTQGTYGLDIEPINGKPAIVYHQVDTEGDTGCLAYVRATDELGLAWGEPQEISEHYGSPYSIDFWRTILIETAEHPAAFWPLMDYTDIMHTQATVHIQCASDPDGDVWQAERALRTYDSFPYGYAAGVIAGKPAYGGIHGTGEEYFYHLYRATDSDGTNWIDSAVHAYAGPTIGDSALLVADGNPALCLHLWPGLGAHRMSWFRAVDAEGQIWGEAVSAFTDQELSGPPDAWLIDGLPAVIIGAAPQREICFACAADTRGSGWRDPVRVATGVEGVMMPYDLREVQGKPAISYVTNVPQGSSNYTLYYVRANDTLGQSWPELEELLVNDGLVYSAMDEIAGFPAIAYAARLGEGQGSEIYYAIKY